MNMKQNKITGIVGTIILHVVVFAYASSAETGCSGTAGRRWCACYAWKYGNGTGNR